MGTVHLSFAEIKLPAIFGNNMVLQQQSLAAVWGWANTGKTIMLKTSWNQKRYTAETDKDGKWLVHISTPVAGGPYKIEISDGKPVVIENILIGEVWLCAGQSNMQMPVGGWLNLPVNGSNEAIATAGNNPQLRLFTVGPSVNYVPQPDCNGVWKPAGPESVRNFSAVAFFYGQFLVRTLHVPIGRINSSYGGSLVHAWMSRGMLEKVKGAPAPDPSGINTKTPQKSPTVLFNAMISPITGFGIKGCIWYQGESDRGNRLYEQLFPQMVEGWRSGWGIGEFPFYFAQIAPLGTWGENNALMREMQLKTAKKIPHSGMAVLLDLGEKDNIHPAEKKTAGLRLAYQALAKTYRIPGLACDGPELDAMNISNDTIYLTFLHAPNGLTSFGKALDEFEMAGSDRKFYPAKAAITKNGITLTCHEVSNPAAARYAFRNYSEASLYNIEGIPASSFRTDNWDLYY